MVNPSWPAISCTHTKDFAAKTVASCLAAVTKKLWNISLKILIFHQIDPLIIFFMKNTTKLILIWIWNGNITCFICFDSIVSKFRVTMLTPQILFDALKTENMPFGVCSMLIIDECHRTYGNHPYNEIMNIYREHKLQGKCVPQVKLQCL